MRRSSQARVRASAFTIIEVRCATAIFALFMLVAFNVFTASTEIVKNDLRQSVAI
jgi:type II secretory pathway pseudopilin PulG